MPDSANDIYVDLTFSAPADGSEDVTSELTLAEADVIGAYNMPVVYTTTDYNSYAGVINFEYTVGSGVSLGLSITTDYFSTGSTTTSGIYVSLVDYDSGSTLASGSENEYVECFLAGETGISGVFGYGDRTRNVLVDYVIGKESRTRVSSVLVEFWKWVSSSGIKDLTTEYYRPPPITVAINRTADITFGSASTVYSGSKDTYVDLTFAGMVNFPLDSDVFCTSESLEKYIITDLTTISGAVVKYITDIFSATVTSGALDFDLFCCLVDYGYVSSELTVISGAVNRIDSDLFSCARIISSIGCDIDLLSLKISNFIPSVDEYVNADGRISVDVTDDVYNVLTLASGITCSGTCCLKVDGSTVPVTFSGITDGYRMYYDPSDDFESLLGNNEFLVHAENSNGDILERSYYLTYGYFVDYENRPRFGADLGYGDRVVVRMSAEDLATCPTYSAEAYWFDSEERDSVELGASIVGVLPEIVSDSGDLSASIYPESLAFFYGKVFRVKLDCKDFVGNEMETYEFEFQIEDASS